jgi:predicted nucleotidyltransferase component of viral defense system
MHGGTAIWRCYGGSRFSGDIDIYLSSKERLREIRSSIADTASNYGVKVEKVKATENLIFIGLSLNDLYLKVEINYKKSGLKPVSTRFENVDGTYTEILILSCEDLILEKIAAYEDRLFARDIYDIYILVDHVLDHDKVKNSVLKFLENIRRPINEPDLRTIIYTGPVPSFDNMIKHIRGRFL